MSHFEYEYGKELEADDAPFYGLIQAAMRRADDKNLEMLRGCWPEVWDELQERYCTPGGLVKSEKYETLGGEKRE